MARLAAMFERTTVPMKMKNLLTSACQFIILVVAVGVCMMLGG